MGPTTDSDVELGESCHNGHHQPGLGSRWRSFRVLGKSDHEVPDFLQKKHPGVAQRDGEHGVGIEF